jgi:hypothetical protein
MNAGCQVDKQKVIRPAAPDGLAVCGRGGLYLSCNGGLLVMSHSLYRLEASLDRLGVSLFGWGKPKEAATPAVPEPAYTTQKFEWTLDPADTKEGPVYFREKFYKDMDKLLAGNKLDYSVFVRDGMRPPHGYPINRGTGTLWIPKKYSMEEMYKLKKRNLFKFWGDGWWIENKAELEKTHTNTGLKYTWYMNK